MSVAALGNRPLPSPNRTRACQSSAPIVDEGELVIRLVDPLHYIEDRLESAHLPMSKPDSDDYGPSVFAASRLPRDIADLESANVVWKAWGAARLTVRDLRSCGVQVSWTPMDCKFGEPLRSAHASLLGVTTRPIRDDVVAMIEKNLERKPKRRTAAAVVFTCKRCGTAHPSTATNPTTGVAQLPGTITTRRDHGTGEWFFVCSTS